jgi:hypothetical protein
MLTFFQESNCHSIQPVVTYMKGKRCVPNNFARCCRDIKHFMAVHSDSLQRFFALFISPALLKLLRILTTGFKLRSILPIIFADLRSLCWNESISTLFCDNRSNGCEVIQEVHFSRKFANFSPKANIEKFLKSVCFRLPSWIDRYTAVEIGSLGEKLALWGIIHKKYRLLLT